MCSSDLLPIPLVFKIEHEHKEPPAMGAPYADPVDLTTATLPKGWKGRLVNLAPGETEGVQGLCLEPHDLAIAKYVASREKDIVFTRELVRRGLTSQGRLLSLLQQTSR